VQHFFLPTDPSSLPGLIVTILSWVVWWVDSLIRMCPFSPSVEFFCEFLSKLFLMAPSSSHFLRCPFSEDCFFWRVKGSLTISVSSWPLSLYFSQLYLWILVVRSLFHFFWTQFCDDSYFFPFFSRNFFFFFLPGLSRG